MTKTAGDKETVINPGKVLIREKFCIVISPLTLFKITITPIKVLIRTNRLLRMSY